MKKGYFFGIIIAAVVLLTTYGIFFAGRTGTQTGGEFSSEISAQQFIIGIINAGHALDPGWDGLRSGLETLGYRDGGNIAFLYKDIAADQETARISAEEYISAGAHMLVVIGVNPAIAAKEATAKLAPNLPIVFLIVSDPIGNGLVSSLSSPGGNITGITPANEVVSGKRVELLKEIMPGLARVVFPYNNAGTAGLAAVRSAASKLGVSLEERFVASPDELDRFLDTFAFRPGDGILRATDSVSSARFKKMIAIANDQKVPLAGSNLNDAESGALMAYGANYFDIGVQGARMVDKILRGASPASLPVELPRRFELAVNLDTARAMRFTVNEDFLSKTDRVIATTPGR